MLLVILGTGLAAKMMSPPRPEETGWRGWEVGGCCWEVHGTGSPAGTLEGTEAYVAEGALELK